MPSRRKARSGHSTCCTRPTCAMPRSADAGRGVRPDRRRPTGRCTWPTRSTGRGRRAAPGPDRRADRQLCRGLDAGPDAGRRPQPGPHRRLRAAVRATRSTTRWRSPRRSSWPGRLSTDDSAALPQRRARPDRRVRHPLSGTTGKTDRRGRPSVGAALGRRRTSCRQRAGQELNSARGSATSTPCSLSRSTRPWRGDVVDDRQRAQVVGADREHPAVVVAALLLDGPGVLGHVGQVVVGRGRRASPGRARSCRRLVLADAAALGQQFGHRYPVEVGQLGQPGDGHGAVAALVGARRRRPSSARPTSPRRPAATDPAAGGWSAGGHRATWRSQTAFGHSQSLARGVSPAIATERDGTCPATRGQVLGPHPFLASRSAGRLSARGCGAALDGRSSTSFNDPSREAGKEVRLAYPTSHDRRQDHSHPAPTSRGWWTGSPTRSWRRPRAPATPSCSASRPAAFRWPAGWPPGSPPSRVSGPGRRPRRHPLPRRPAAARRPRARADRDARRRHRRQAGDPGRRRALLRAYRPGRAGRAGRPRPPPLGPAGRAGRPGPPGAAHPRRLRRQEHPDRAGRERAGALAETDGADEVRLPARPESRRDHAAPALRRPTWTRATATAGARHRDRDGRAWPAAR